MATGSAQVSTTIPKHIDEYLDLLAVELQISKSSLVADAIARGLPVIVDQFILQRRECIETLKNTSKARDKAEADPSKGKPAAVIIEYAAEATTL